MFLAVVSALLLLQAGVPGRVSGRVLEWDGKPAANVRVALETIDARPGESDALASLTRTDASGDYRFEDVKPGRYRMIAGPLNTPTYYPGGNNAARAEAITIRAAGEIAGLNFKLIINPVTTLPDGRAHHSYSAAYDGTQRIALTGRLTDVNSDASRLFFSIAVGNGDGSESIWQCEGPLLSAAARQGWTVKAFDELRKKGENVSVSGAPAKDGSLRLVALETKTAGGRTLSFP